MPGAVDDLLAILDLEQLEHNLFRGRSPQVGWQRVFGGQVIGQALVAACRTVDVRTYRPHEPWPLGVADPGRVARDQSMEKLSPSWAMTLQLTATVDPHGLYSVTPSAVAASTA